MSRFICLVFVFCFIICHRSEAQKQMVHKFVCLKSIEKKTQVSFNRNETGLLLQLQEYIVKNNPLADTGRTEFQLLIRGLQDQISKKDVTLTPDFYNQKINNYNNVCQILDYLKQKNLPAAFLAFSQDFYLAEIQKNGKTIDFSKVKHAFEDNYTVYKLVKTGNKPYQGKEVVAITQHNQLEKILAAYNPKFTAFSVKKQLKYQRQVQVINPWVGSFKKGLTYNTTRETFFADDEMLLLIPE